MHVHGTNSKSKSAEQGAIKWDKIISYTYIYSRHTGKKRKTTTERKKEKKGRRTYLIIYLVTLHYLHLNYHIICRAAHTYLPVGQFSPVSQSVSLASCAPLTFLLFDATYSYSFVRFSYFFDPAHAAPITEKKKTTPLKPHRTYKPPHTPHTQTQTPAPGLAFNPAPCPR